MKTKTNKNELSWTPRRKGIRYCSPACGGGCMLSDYRKAKAKAEKLANELGPTWKPIVHENLGWHWRVENLDGNLEVHVYSDEHVWVSLMTGGRQFCLTDTSVKGALKALAASVASHITEMSAAVGLLNARTAW